jgi:hypothetical protein
MKAFKSSDLTHKRSEVLKEAKLNGVIIQERNTNGDVRCEYVLVTKDKYMGINDLDQVVAFNKPVTEFW